MREEKDWFVVIEGGDSKHYYGKEELTTKRRTNILEGKHGKNDKALTHNKDERGNWQQAEFTLIEFAKSHFKLRVLYQPVWSHAIAGLKWGAIVGVGLNLLFTLIGLAHVDLAWALLFLGVILVVFIHRIRFIVVLVVVLLMHQFTEAFLFMTGLVAAFTGAILGCLPGMTLGGILGFSIKSSLPHAKDATPEPKDLFVKAVLLPLIGGCGLYLFYILLVIPWIYSVLIYS